ncbi:hypothetical protein Pmani_027609 [Petrolisthes manimaculis]|uniref:Uncharacterized protein n=1 Tax=Petrolisthes manimaculis TaxID=1843537 RepID=A0AAE1TWC3_9EUCA|nr:hypothetical protein Pmani_027609 [Petrolisthes manimaculis]
MQKKADAEKASRSDRARRLAELQSNPTPLPAQVDTGRDAREFQAKNQDVMSQLNAIKTDLKITQVEEMEEMEVRVEEMEVRVEEMEEMEELYRLQVETMWTI